MPCDVQMLCSCVFVSHIQAHDLSCQVSTTVAEALLCAGRMPLVMPYLAKDHA